MTTPKHRANKLTKTEPRMQPAGRHAAPVPARGSVTFSIAELMQAAFGPNPYRRGAGV